MHTLVNPKFIYPEKTYNGQQVYEKIHSITYYQGNINKNHNEISPSACCNDYY